MNKQANNRGKINTQEKSQKNKRKKWARILTLSTSITLFTLILIFTIVFGATDFRVSALMLNGIIVVFTLIAIYMPLASGIVLLILDIIWLAIIDKYWENFRDYGTAERLLTVCLTLLLLILIVGTVLHIYDGWQHRKKS